MAHTFTMSGCRHASSSGLEPLSSPRGPQLRPVPCCQESPHVNSMWGILALEWSSLHTQRSWQRGLADERSSAQIWCTLSAVRTVQLVVAATQAAPLVAHAAAPVCKVLRSPYAAVPVPASINPDAFTASIFNKAIKSVVLQFLSSWPCQPGKLQAAEKPSASPQLPTTTNRRAQARSRQKYPAEGPSPCTGRCT